MISNQKNHVFDTEKWENPQKDEVKNTEKEHFPFFRQNFNHQVFWDTTFDREIAQGFQICFCFQISTKKQKSLRLNGKNHCSKNGWSINSNVTLKLIIMLIWDCFSKTNVLHMKKYTNGMYLHQRQNSFIEGVYIFWEQGFSLNRWTCVNSEKYLFIFKYENSPQHD